MREHVAFPVISPLRTSIKISRRDENSDNTKRRVAGGCLGYLGGNPTGHMPGGRLKGGISILNSGEQEAVTNLSESLPDKMTENGKITVEKDRAKRKVSEETMVLLQWGHRKRPRGNRIDLKHVTTVESSLLLKKTIRAERRVLKNEQEVAVEQMFEYTCHGGTRKEESEATRRNGHDNSCPPSYLRNSNNSHSLKQPHGLSLPSPEKPDFHHVSPDICRNGSDVPAAVQKVDLDLFEWPKIFISLSRKEKEDDFLTMKGIKLPQRPKRRPKVVEKALHYCSPGTWLGDLARGRYDVREKKSVKKKPRGLKAMESMDSDSE